jgi:ABC-type glycerol-3-phosphate transport system substrate-binding protein
MLIAPSDFAATLPKFRYAFTLMPAGSFARASVARVNGWAVAAKSSDPDAARALAGYLAYQPVHAGWSRVQPPSDDAIDTPEAICHEALSRALVPRIEPGTAELAQFLDEQINLLARNSTQADSLYADIQARFKKSSARHPFENSLPVPDGLNPRADASSPLRDF